MAAPRAYGWFGAVAGGAEAEAGAAAGAAGAAGWVAGFFTTPPVHGIGMIQSSFLRFL